MGLGRNKQTLLKVGEFAQTASATYYGGSPAMMSTAGTVELATRTKLLSSGSYVGIFYNTSVVDALTEGDKATFLAGTCVLTFMKATPNTNNSVLNVEGSAGVASDDYPYDTTLTWAPGDKLYLGATTSGTWSNVNSGTDEALGVVLVAGTNYLTVLMNNKAGAYIHA